MPDFRLVPTRCNCSCHDGSAAHVGPCRCTDQTLSESVASEVPLRALLAVVDAARVLHELKVGPRDSAYHRRKPQAWADLAAALAALEDNQDD